jgi:hypothetical protein
MGAKKAAPSSNAAEAAEDLNFIFLRLEMMTSSRIAGLDSPPKRIIALDDLDVH